MQTYLAISWAISRGRDTYGYNICRLDDTLIDVRYRCMGAMTWWELAHQIRCPWHRK
jgi:hypothetical protein